MEKKIINGLIVGGLGNKLFQLFTLISTSIDKNRPFKILYDKNDRRYNDIIYDCFFKKLENYVNNQDNYLDIHENYKHLIHFENSSFPVPTTEISDNYEYLAGHYENFIYFNHNKEKIIKFLEIDYYQSLLKFNFDKTICLHLRFEDNFPNNIKSCNYYIKCFDELNKHLNGKINEYKIIVFIGKFENDNELINNYLTTLKTTFHYCDFIIFRDLFPNVSLNEEFIYMSNCNYFITAHSTFSLLAFYLCPHKNKFATFSNSYMERPILHHLPNDSYICITED